MLNFLTRLWLARNRRVALGMPLPPWSTSGTRVTASMARKGFTSVDQLRGMLAVPFNTDESQYERAGYVSALRTANASAYDPW